MRKNQAAAVEEAVHKKAKFAGFKRMSTASKISLAVLVLVALSAIFASVIAPHDPFEIFIARQAPSPSVLFGTDDKGRDNWFHPWFSCSCFS